MGVRLLWALLSGILFALALPPRNAEWLGWVAFVPLLWAVSAPRKSAFGTAPPRTLHAYGLGMVSGLVAGVTQIGWHPNRGALTFAYVPYIWIALVLGGIAALANWGQKQAWAQKPGRWVVFVVCAGVLVEWMTTFSPLPVGVALCQNRNATLIQICAFTGIWGVGFLLWLVNAAFVDAVLRYRPKQRSVPLPLFASGGLAAAVLLWGTWTLHQVPAPNQQNTLTVAAIQDFSGVDAHDFAPESNLAENLPDSEALTRQAAKQGARLIVGTENALGYAFSPDDPKSQTALLARQTGAFLVVGYETNADPRPFNCAALVAPDGKTVGVHHKLRLFLGEKQTMQAGQTIQTWNTPFAKIGLLICFDTCYTGDVRRVVQTGAQIIAVPNYDPPTPGDSLHNLHAALVPFRAVENGVAIVRADPNGRSQILDAQGRRIVPDSPMFRAVALVAPVALGNGKGTFFTRWGDWLAYGCAFTVLLYGVLGRLERKVAPYAEGMAADSAPPLSSQPISASVVAK